MIRESSIQVSLSSHTQAPGVLDLTLAAGRNGAFRVFSYNAKASGVLELMGALMSLPVGVGVWT